MTVALTAAGIAAAVAVLGLIGKGVMVLIAGAKHWVEMTLENKLLESRLQAIDDLSERFQRLPCVSGLMVDCPVSKESYAKETRRRQTGSSSEDA